VLKIWVRVRVLKTQCEGKGVNLCVRVRVSNA
jgi:hypothetical protein